MKITVKQLKQVIREEYIRGVPEFVLRQATEKYVKEIRNQLFKHILLDRSKTQVEQKRAVSAANEALDQFENDTNASLEDVLWSFLQKT